MIIATWNTAGVAHLPNTSHSHTALLYTTGPQQAQTSRNVNMQLQSREVTSSLPVASNQTDCCLSQKISCTQTAGGGGHVRK
jgi:hypothetical protein